MKFVLVPILGLCWVSWDGSFSKIPDILAKLGKIDKISESWYSLKFFSKFLLIFTHKNEYKCGVEHFLEFWRQEKQEGGMFAEVAEHFLQIQKPFQFEEITEYFSKI